MITRIPCDVHKTEINAYVIDNADVEEGASVPADDVSALADEVSTEDCPNCKTFDWTTE